MIKTIRQFLVTNQDEFKIKMLNWSRRFNIFILLDNNNYTFEDPAFEFMLAAGCRKSVSPDASNIFLELKKFSAENPGWLFGHFSYPVVTAKPYNDKIAFPAGFFFIPEIKVSVKGNVVSIESHDKTAAEIFKAINEQPAFIDKTVSTNADIRKRYSKEEYIATINALRKHIQKGDCYEINFCQDFYCDDATADPFFLYQELFKISPNPFAAFYRLEYKYCMCASPERFLRKRGNRLISQPIKGTSKRDLANSENDNINKNYLLSSKKEKSENVMIVDLVRNDLSRICMEGSVQVSELFGIYSFPQVHQMISTIEGKVADDIHWTDIVKECFPMGSMTGAPKIKVMELIDRYELISRGLFSGTIGYIDPAGNFDFNVVIRSLFYNQTNNSISFKAGSGITFYSNAEDEYEECMLKAAAMMRLLGAVDKLKG